MTEPSRYFFLYIHLNRFCEKGLRPAVHAAETRFFKLTAGFLGSRMSLQDQWLQSM